MASGSVCAAEKAPADERPDGPVEFGGRGGAAGGHARRTVSLGKDVQVCQHAARLREDAPTIVPSLGHAPGGVMTEAGERALRRRQRLAGVPVEFGTSTWDNLRWMMQGVPGSQRSGLMSRAERARVGSRRERALVDCVEHA